MVKHNSRLVEVLRKTADRLESGAEYRWTHMGACNCGHVAQTLTGLSAVEIRRITYERPGEWTEHARDYCPTSGLKVDEVMGAMLDLGMTLDQVAHLEKLSDPDVLSRCGVPRRELDHRNRDHVVAYMRAWAAMKDGA